MAAFPLKGGTYGERLSLPSPLHAGTAEPLRVSPPEAVAYLLELIVGPLVPLCREEVLVGNVLRLPEVSRDAPDYAN